METIFTKKTCLHIACGFGKLEIVRFIVINCKHLITCVDEHGRNALHYVTKEGNLKILKFFITKTVWLLDLERQIITLYYTVRALKALRDVKICQYAMDDLCKDLLNNRTKECGLTAAHYLRGESKRNGSEIKIFKIFCNSEMDLMISFN